MVGPSGTVAEIEGDRNVANTVLSDADRILTHLRAPQARTYNDQKFPD